MIKGFYPKDNEIRHIELLNDGFEYNNEYDFYYNEYGALVYEGPCDLESFLNIWWVKKLTDLGYEFGYGIPSTMGRMRGHRKSIYCTNYQQIVEKYKKDNIVKRKKL